MSGNQKAVMDLPAIVDVKPFVWVSLGYVTLLLGLLTLMVAGAVGQQAWWAHGVWCVVMGCVLVGFLLRAMRGGVGVVLSDHRFAFVASFVLYFVIGAGIFAFPSLAPSSRVAIGYPISAGDVLFIDASNAIGLGLVMLGSVLAPTRPLAQLTEGVAVGLRRLPHHLVIVGFLVVGAVATVVVDSTDLGIGPPIVSGTWRLLSSLSLVGIFLGVSHIGSWRRPIVVGAVATVLVKTGLGVLLFNKTEMLMPVMALLLGLAVMHRSWKPLVVGRLLVALTFSSLGSLAIYGRISLPGVQDAASLVARVDLVARGIRGDIESSAARSYSGWSRLCYIPQQHAVRVLFDSGQGGSDFALLPWVFVPRALVSTKPVITSAGSALDRRISGNPFSGSATSAGIIMEGYYNGGWMALALVSLAAGAILASTSRVAGVILRRRSMVLLPIAMLGVLIAFRIDGHFVGDFVGRFVYVFYAVAILGGVSLVAERRKPTVGGQSGDLEVMRP